MQIYLTCPASETDPIGLIQHTLTRHHLQDEFSLATLSDSEPGAHKIIEPISATAALTVIATALGAGGAITVGMGKDGAITQLVKALEALINRKVEVKITHNNATVELSGSAGPIEKILKELLK
ncbi:MAG: hypothetical protein PHU14_05820 [Methylovulum sp.]|nr:hypothetical protein [Methylovulum sp.]